MKKNLTYVIFVVDRSGSMETIAKDMIGGFNSFVKVQRTNQVGDCRVFFYQFDTEYETVYDGVDVNRISDLTDKTYIPRGSTALYDSLGKTIVDVGAKLAAMPESERPEKVLFVTITDGLDNDKLEKTEKHYTLEEVKKMIEHQTSTYKWDFAYIGANQDAWAVGSSMGSGASLGYQATSKGTAVMFDNLTKSATLYRASAGAKFAFCPTTDKDKN